MRPQRLGRINRARSLILNGYDAVGQEAYVAGDVLGPDFDGVLPIGELRCIKIEVKGSIEGSAGQSDSDVRARNVR